MTPSPTEEPPTPRQRWLGILARATRAELETAWRAVAPPGGFTYLRPPETGLVLVRGRIGGSGAPFNLGEMTVSRCTVRADGGATGTGYVAGTDQRHATLAALLDALLQDPERGPALAAAVVEPLAAAQAARRRAEAARTAATKVDFFTLVRGDG